MVEIKIPETELTAEIDSQYNQFLINNKHEPKLAHCEVMFLDDQSVCDAKINLDGDNNDEDEMILWYCNSIGGLKSLTIPSMIDFVVLKCYELTD